MLELDVCHVVCQKRWRRCCLPPPRSRTDSGRHLEKGVCGEFSSFCGAVTDRPCNRLGLAVGLHLIVLGSPTSVSVCLWGAAGVVRVMVRLHPAQQPRPLCLYFTRSAAALSSRGNELVLIWFNPASYRCDKLRACRAVRWKVIPARDERIHQTRQKTVSSVCFQAKEALIRTSAFTCSAAADAKVF